MNAVLRHELKQLLNDDKEMRTRMWSTMQSRGSSSPEYETARQEASQVMQRNTGRLLEIVEHHGWPGTSLVGREACTAAFLILQHADLKTQLRLLPLLQTAVDNGEAEKQALALLEDRIRMREGKPQIYGSQLRQGPEGKPELYPIADPDGVDELRDRVGLPPLMEYLRRAGLEHLHPKSCE